MKDSSGRVLVVNVNQYGFPYVSLIRDQVRYQRGLALLVARAFLEPFNEFFDTPINLNGDRLNCSVDNLMWRPRWFARKYNQQFTQKYRSKALRGSVRAIETGEVFGSPLEAACRYGLLELDIRHNILRGGQTWPEHLNFELVDAHVY
jgi:hypothetical protein